MHFSLFKHQVNFPGEGLFSVCSAHPLVIRAAMEYARDAGMPLVVESTVNQVNPDGGYTGMQPDDFHRFLQKLAAESHFPFERLIIGSDHLGPYPWRHLPAEKAMARARLLTEQSVQAGYRKLHLDTSMACYGDPVPLDVQTMAERTAALAAVAEATAARLGRADNLFYIVGTEVPPPGGAAQTLKVTVTPVDQVKETVAAIHQAFRRQDLHRAWERVIAVVVQPGVEFSNHEVVDYQPKAAAHLAHLQDELEGMVFEAHSTDYQLPAALRQLVLDGFAILKVGPWLTFALREGLMALAHMEMELAATGKIAQPSRLRQVLLQEMNTQPDFWQPYCQNDLEKWFGFSDRIRYYWAKPAVEQAVKQLINNLKSIEIPPGLLSQYLPDLYPAVRAGLLANEPDQLLLAKVKTILAYYHRAVAS